MQTKQSRCKTLTPILLLLLSISLAAVPLTETQASEYELLRYVISKGSINVSNQDYSLKATIGQAVIGSGESGGYRLSSGFWPAFSEPICDCLPGDADGNGVVNISDAVYLISYIFAGGPPPTPYPICSGDANRDCIVNVSDVVYEIAYIFGGGPAPGTCEDWVGNCGPLQKGGEGQFGDYIVARRRPTGGRATVMLTGRGNASDEGAMAAVSIASDIAIAGIQLEFEVNLTMVGEIIAGKTERSEDLELFYHVNDDLLRVGLIDMTGEHCLQPGEGPVVTLRLAGGSYEDLELDNVVLADRGARELEVTIGKAEEAAVNLPQQYSLRQNYPNPFNPTTEIGYALPEAAEVRLEIFNLLGQRVRTLVEQHQPAGWHRVSWDSSDEQRQPLPSGVYFYRLTAGDFSESKKMLLLK